MDEVKRDFETPNPVFQYAGEKWAGGCICDSDCGLPPQCDGLWYFWDETWFQAIGPYETYEAADLALAQYAAQL